MTNEYSFKKNFKWQELGQKLNGVVFIQAESVEETLAYLAQTPPQPGIMLFGDSTGSADQIWVSSLKVSDLPNIQMQWKELTIA